MRIAIQLRGHRARIRWEPASVQQLRERPLARPGELLGDQSARRLAPLSAEWRAAWRGMRPLSRLIQLLRMPTGGTTTPNVPTFRRTFLTRPILQPINTAGSLASDMQAVASTKPRRNSARGGRNRATTHA